MFTTQVIKNSCLVQLKSGIHVPGCHWVARGPGANPAKATGPQNAAIAALVTLHPATEQPLELAVSLE